MRPQFLSKKEHADNTGGRSKNKHGTLDAAGEMICGTSYLVDDTVDARAQRVPQHALVLGRRCVLLQLLAQGALLRRWQVHTAGAPGTDGGALLELLRGLDDDYIKETIRT